jgi:hypothetical protein
MACPFTFEYVVFCPECGKKIRHEDKRDDSGKCDKCHLDLKDYLTRGIGRLVFFPIEKQIQNYLGNETFTALLRVFHSAPYGKLTGPVHKNNFKNIDLDLRLGIDAAPMTREGYLAIYPAVIFINNLPLSLQHRYPILAALYIGPASTKPPRFRMLENFQKEVRQMSIKQLEWKDDRSQVHFSYVYLTMVHSDGPEKQDLQNMVGLNGRFSCSNCMYEGVLVDKDNNPEVYDPTNDYRRSSGPNSIGIRYI